MVKKGSKRVQKESKRGPKGSKGGPKGSPRAPLRTAKRHRLIFLSFLTPQRPPKAPKPYKKHSFFIVPRCSPEDPRSTQKGPYAQNTNFWLRN